MGKLSRAIRAAFISPHVCNADLEPANIVDALGKLAYEVRQFDGSELAASIKALQSSVETLNLQIDQLNRELRGDR